MSRRACGVSLIAVAALLYTGRYLAAAIFGSSITSWNTGLFNSMLQYVGPNLMRLSVISLLFGIFYLVWAETVALQAGRRSDRNEQKE